MKTVFGLSFCSALILSTASMAQPVGPPQSGDSDEVVLTFRGQIDGSEKIEITTTHAYWHHGDWSLPEEPVTLNGVRWEPKKDRTLENEGATRFLPRGIDFRSARLKKLHCRDTVALDLRADSLVIAINDTPNGADLYEFQVIFRPQPRRASLRVVAEIDGSDQLHLDATGARWVHGQWDAPKEVRLNQVRWYPNDPSVLKNQDATRFLEGPVDFSTAKLTVNQGRDTAVLEHTAKGLVVHFADNPLGRATYDVTISFGN